MLFQCFSSFKCNVQGKKFLLFCHSATDSLKLLINTHFAIINYLLYAVV